MPIAPNRCYPFFVLFFALAAALPAQSDKPGYKDPPLFTRLPHYWLSEGGSFEEKQFESHEFRTAGGKSRAVEGRYTKYMYVFDEQSESARASTIQVMRNYQNAAAKVGGKVLFQNDEYMTIQIVANGKETWVDLQPTYNSYTLVIVEKEAMQQDVAANAGALKSGLAQEGHVQVPGIFFDFGKSDLKPESGASLKELLKLLQANPSMRAWVVGHTDAVGSPDTNLTLSNARAGAVIRALVQMGIDAKRLAPHGAGPFAPVATNKTDEGRSRNRRVELVEQP